jgi:tetratricopeptide (TPR) repeat protein
MFWDFNFAAADTELGTSHQEYQNVPLPHNPRFTGRENILSILDEMFFSRHPSSQRVALVGLGGMGKTQVALQFANYVKKRQPHALILWVPVLSDNTVEQAYADMAHRLNLPKYGNKQTFKELVCRYLSSDAAGRWFMVVDNADDHDLVFGSQDQPGVENFLPHSESGSILLTTRSRQVAEEFAQSEVVELDQMSTEEAMCFFEKSMIRKDDAKNTALVAKLLDHLMHLPLAIAQAAAYINQTKMPIQNYLSLLLGADAARVFSREFKDNTRYKSSQNAIATTWLMSFEQIRKQNDTAIEILAFLSCIEPKAIPQSLLSEVDQEELEWAIGILCGYSFLVRRNDSDIFDMHSLVHLAMRRSINKQGQRDQTLYNAVKQLTAVLSKDQSDYSQIRLYLPHALRVVEQCNHQTKELADLQMVVGKALYDDRRFSEAAFSLERTVAWRRDHLPEESEVRLDAEHELSRAYLDDRQHKEAIDILERILHVRRRISPQEHHYRLFSEILLGRTYLEVRRIKDAIELLEHVAAVRRAIHPEDNHYRLVAEHVLASTYVSDSQIKRAISIFEHIVAVDRKTLARSDFSSLDIGAGARWSIHSRPPD